MPTLPLDHPDPFAATLATMLYPATEEHGQRQMLTEYLLPLVQSYRQSWQPLAYDHLMGRVISVASEQLPDLEQRVFAATAVGQLVKTFLLLAREDEKTASLGNTYAIANSVAGPLAKRGISRSYFKMQQARFKSVAHLCAALSLRDLQFKPGPLVGYGPEADFHSFLAEAEWVRDWGSFWKRPASTALPYFDGVEMWIPPVYWRPVLRRSGWPLTGGMADLVVHPSLTARLKRVGRPRQTTTVNPL